jgi:hypothetical protein
MWLSSQFSHGQLDDALYLKSVIDGWYGQMSYTSTSSVLSGWWLKVAKMLDDQESVREVLHSTAYAITIHFYATHLSLKLRTQVPNIWPPYS